MKVTIYTQAYNTEKYISKCIESVLNQTYTAFEYFLVDNGSTDSTISIMNRYAEIDDRIKIIRYENNTKGLLSLLRTQFRGNYCSIIDSDDWWESDFLERMISFLENNKLDLAVTGTIIYYDNDGTSHIMRKLEDPIILSQKQFADDYPLYWHFTSTYWGNIMKTELLRKATFSSEIISYGGDTINMLAYIDQCENIGIDNSALYHYRIRENSLSYDYDFNRFHSNIVYYNSISHYLKKHNTLDYEKQEWLKLVHSNSIRMTAETLANSTLLPPEKINELLKIVEHPLTIDVLSLNHIDIQKMRDVLLSILFKNIDSSDILNEILKILTPKCASAIKLECISLIIMKPQLADSLVADDPDALLTALLDMIGKNELIKKYDLFSMVRALSSDKLLLKAVDDKKFIRRHADVYLAIWRGQYNRSLDMMTNVLQKGEKTDESFLQLYLNTAALTNSTDEFLYGKLRSAGYLLYIKKYDECRAEINDLSEMGVEDNDEIIRIKRELEKVGK